MIRPKKRADLKTYVLNVLLVLLLVWIGFLLMGIVHKEEIARRAADEARRDLALLNERSAMLTENLAELETARGEEATLRETFGVALPGEEVIIVVPDEGEEPQRKRSLWEILFDWLPF